jgi:hypothetical protein
VAFGGGAVLVTRTYIVERCFQRSGFGGCSYLAESFGTALGDAPLRLLPPIALVVILAAAAVAAYVDARNIGLAFGAFALVVPGLLRVAGPLLLVPALALLAAFMLAQGATPATTTRLILRLSAVVGGAFALAYGVSLLWVRTFSGFPGGVLETYWLFAGSATAVGLIGGIAMTRGLADPAQLVKGVLLAYVVFGVASLVATISAVPLLYPNGTYVKSAAGLGGVAGLFLLALVIGSVVASFWVARRRVAAVLASAALGFALFVIGSFVSWVGVMAFA